VITMYELLHKYRQNSGESWSNRRLAKTTWVYATFVVLFFGAMLLFRFTAPAAPGESWSAPVVGLTQWSAVAVVVWFFLGSLVYPARALEKRLDERYPDHMAEPVEYQLTSDVAASATFTALWGLRAAIVVAVVTFTFTIMELVTIALDLESPLTAHEVTQLTLLNSAVLAIFGVIGAGVALYYAVEYFVSPNVAAAQTGSNNSFRYDVEREQLGGEGADG